MDLICTPMPRAGNRCTCRFQRRQRDEFQSLEKHPNLEGYMANLYYTKRRHREMFNCVNVELTGDDLDALERVIKEDKLPETCGFFFGETDGSEREDDWPSSQRLARVLARVDMSNYTSCGSGLAREGAHVAPFSSRPPGAAPSCRGRPTR